jgi:hypothetical protein
LLRHSGSASGNGVGDFVGRFSVETFIVAPGQAPVPKPVHPKDAPLGTQSRQPPLRGLLKTELFSLYLFRNGRNLIFSLGYLAKF